MEPRLGCLSGEKSASRELIIRQIIESFHLLQKQEKPLINVFFIRELYGNHREDIFDKLCPIALVPDH